VICIKNPSRFRGALGAEPIGQWPLESQFCGVALLMSTPDQDTLLLAIEDARRILCGRPAIAAIRLACGPRARTKPFSLLDENVLKQRTRYQ
jgi:hypothetical protein